MDEIQCCPGLRTDSSPVRLHSLSEEEQERGCWELPGRNWWKRLLMGYVPLEEETEEGSPLGNPERLLLIGPARSGKRTLLSGLEGELEDAGYLRILLDLPALPEEQREAAMAAAAQLTEGRRAVIRLEHVEALEPALLRRLEECCSGSEQLLLTAALDGDGLPAPAYRELAACFRVALPDEDDRTAVLKVALPPVSAETRVKFLHLTEGFDYGRLQTFLTGIYLLIRSEMRERRTTAERIAEKLKPATIEKLAKRLPPLEEDEKNGEPEREAGPDWQALVQSAIRAVEALAQSISAAPLIVPQPVQTPQTGSSAPGPDASPAAPGENRTIVRGIKDLIGENDTLEDVLIILSPKELHKKLDEGLRVYEDKDAPQPADAASAQ